MERLLVRVLDGAGTTPVDLSVELADDATVGELCDRVACAVGAASGLTVQVRWPDDAAGPPLVREQLVAEVGPRSGASIALVEPVAGTPPAPSCSPVALSPAAGEPTRLPYGTTDLRGAQIDVGQCVELRSTGRTVATLNGQRVRGSARLADGDLIGAGDLHAVVRIGGDLFPPPRHGPTLPHASGPPNRVPFDPATIDLPDPPGSMRVPGFPVLSATVPLLMGAALWVATRSLASAMFVLFSFVFVLASGIEARRESKAEMRFRELEFRDELDDAVERIHELRTGERATARARTPGGRAAAHSVTRRDPWVWSQRPDGRGVAPLLVSVGRAELEARNRAVVPPSGRRDLRSELDEVAARHARHELPVEVDLTDRGGLVLVGSDERATDIARSIVVQVAAATSPDLWSIQVLAAAHRRPAWAWAEWLPALGSATSLGAPHRLLVVDGATDAEVTAALSVSSESGSCETGSSESVSSESGASGSVVLLWLTGSPVGLPRGMTQVLTVGPDGARLVHRDLDGAPQLVVEGIEPDVVAEDDALLAARRLAPLRPAGASIQVGQAGSLDRAADAPRDATLQEILASPEELDDPVAAGRRWRRSAAVGLLGAPLGRAGSGVVSIDLRLDGPHVLVAGTTGAGKSELLRTLLCSLALAHDPGRLTFLLIDYKGGAAFRSLVELPHTVGLVTDLTDELAARALVSLRAEVRRREQLLERHGATDLSELTTHPGAEGSLEVPPALVVAVDEFATLAREVPGFVDGLVDVAQRGRSLGIHLVLATQRPAGVVTDAIRANTSLRICLRVADVEDSKDVVDVPDAGAIPRELPGRAVVRIAADRPFPLQVAWSGGTGADDERVRCVPLGADPARPTPTASDTETELDRAVRTIRSAAEQLGIPSPRRPWLEPLADRLAATELAVHSGSPALAIGLVDRPDQQRQALLAVDLSADGGVLVLGASGSGRSTALASLAAACGASTEPWIIHGIDAANGLSAVRGTRGVGDVVRVDDVERVTRLVRSLIAELRHRQLTELPSDGQRVAAQSRRLLVIDGFAAFDELYSGVNGGELLDLLVRLAREGRSLGLHLAIAAQRRAELPPALVAMLGCRLDLRCASEDEASLLGLGPSAAAPDLPPGRGFIRGATMQIALPELVAAEADAGPTAVVGRLPERLRFDQVPPRNDGPPWSLLLGLDGDSLGRAELDLSHHHAVIAGPPRSGRSSTLDLLASQIDRSFLLSALPGERAVEWSEKYVGVDVDGVERMVTAAVAAAEAGRLTMLAVDDLPELLGGPDEASIEALLLGALDAARALLLRLVVSGEIDAMARTYGDLMSRLRSGRTGVVLRPDPDLHAGLLHATLPRRDELAPCAGRGWLVHPDRALPVQIALPST